MREIYFVKEKDSAEYLLEGVPLTAKIQLEKDADTWRLKIQTEQGWELASIRQVVSWRDASLKISKGRKKDFIDGV